jgi:hypothetical protein
VYDPWMLLFIDDFIYLLSGPLPYFNQVSDNWRYWTDSVADTSVCLNQPKPLTRATTRSSNQASRHG